MVIRKSLVDLRDLRNLQMVIDDLPLKHVRIFCMIVQVGDKQFDMDTF